MSMLCPGQNLKLIRQFKKISQTKLAKRSHYSRIYIYYLEKDKRPITEKNIKELARALNVSIKDLINPVPLLNKFKDN